MSGSCVTGSGQAQVRISWRRRLKGRDTRRARLRGIDDAEQSRLRAPDLMWAADPVRVT